MTLLGDLSIVLLVAAGVTIVCHYLRQPVVLGYILAGVIIGPHTPPFQLITDTGSIRTLAELGVVMLMFALGLQFSLRGLIKVGPTASVAAVLEIGLMIWIGYQAGRLFGWNRMDSAFLGAMLLSSSTVIIVKALNDLRMAEEPFARLIFGILVLDDIAAIVAIAVLSGIGLTQTLSPMAVLATSGRIALFLTVVIVVGLLALPRLFRFVARFRNDEVLLVTVLGLGFGMALLAVKLGLSTALGAFVVGAVIAEARESGRIRALVEPVRDMFSAIFFVSIGLALDPVLAWEYRVPVLVVTLTLVLGKTLTGAVGAFVAGNDPRTSLRVGMGLAQIGEFAFIIATLGRDLKVTSEFLYPVAVSVSGLTTLTTPLLIRGSDSLARGIESIAPQRVRHALAFYTQWLDRLAAARQQSGQVRDLLRRWSLQMGLNMVLISAVFVGASAAAFWLRPRLEPWCGQGGANAVILLSAMLLSLPMAVATMRKLRASAMLMAEVAIRHGQPEHLAMVRNLTVRAVTGGGVLALVLYVLLIAVPILPSWPVVLLVLAVATGATMLYWGGFVHIYARAQISLRDTMEARPLPMPKPPPAANTILADAVMEVVIVGPDAPGAGKLIRELELRSRTGASIVGIERQGQSIVNPGPDEELQAGDRVLLIGNLRQVRAGKAALA